MHRWPPSSAARRAAARAAAGVSGIALVAASAAAAPSGPAPAANGAMSARSSRAQMALGHRRADDATPAAPPRVVLRLEARTTRGPWMFEVRNAGDAPVHLVADPRALTIDLFPRSARSPIHCELPATMRPEDPFERVLVLPPGRAFAARFEPRLYCFGTAGFDALASGTIAIAHLGFGPGSRPPFVVAPIDGVEPIVPGVRTLDAPPIALPDIAAGRESAVHPPAPLDAPHLALTSATAVDATSADLIALPLTLRNEGSAPVTVRFRPETIGFDVIATDTGAFERCAWPMVLAAPTREEYQTLPPHGQAELTVVLEAYCARGSLDRAGLLVVRPWLDTRAASGASIGLRTVDGRWTAAAPTFVRLQKGRVAAPLVRPRLQEP